MTDAPYLVIVDMQNVFGDPSSGWFTADFGKAAAVIESMLPSFGDRVIRTRFVAPAHPEGAWVAYYEQWPFALVPADDPLYDLVPAVADAEGAVVTETTFGKWGENLRRALGGSTEIVLTGVSTDCCIISTALPAADAGMHVRVVSDGCAGLSETDHRRALDAMALYAPLIEITDSETVLAGIR
jgi:nicotinamidase-related amidase